MDRPELLEKIHHAFEVHPVVGLLGPRQVGKTTLARMYAKKEKSRYSEIHFFDLEDPTHLARLEQPKLILEDLSGLVVIDEIQKKPNLFELIRVLVDRPTNKTQFLALGSASRDLIKQSSETLAGRIEYLEIFPFSLEEVGLENWKKRWLRGGFPKAYLADSENKTFQWLEAFIRNYLERDIPNLGIRVPADTLRRFWMMLVHNHGNLLNASELGRSFGIADTTVRHYLDILSGTFMIRLLPPWHENIKKRQIKTPKIYFKDTGILHSFLGTKTKEQLETHPKLGASWEGFALEQVIQCVQAKEGELYFWGIHSQAELDLLILKNGKKIGFEIKFTEKPKITPSIKKGLEFLNLDHIYIIHPSMEKFSLAQNITAMGLNSLFTHFR